MTAIASKPKYVQLADHMRDLIRDGELKIGDRLPSYAEMYRRFGATPATAQRVCDLLEQENLIERRGGSGVYVAERKRILTGNIGFVGTTFINPEESPYKSHIMAGVQQAVDAAQQHLLYLGTDPNLNVQAFDKVDGVLISNVDDARPVLRKLPAGMPRVSLIIIHNGLTNVVADDHGGVKMAVEHLVSLGHRRIACLMEKLPSLARRRLAGYNDGLLEAGIDPDPQWVRLTDTAPISSKADYYLEWGRRQMRLWLEEGFEKLQCTALFVQNERAAIGAMQILQQEGWKVPDDISVMGFDGTELCDYAVPRLCAVELPLTQIGIQAVEILNRQIAGEILQPQTITLPVSLREGGSVAPSTQRTVRRPAELSAKVLL
jgi:DNA-binding LacI/PurR family transcriptional regulator